MRRELQEQGIILNTKIWVSRNHFLCLDCLAVQIDELCLGLGLYLSNFLLWSFAYIFCLWGFGFDQREL